MGNSQDVEFTYAKFRITDIEFNNPTRYKDTVAELHLRYMSFISNPSSLVHELYDYDVYHHREPLGTLRSEYIPSPPLAVPLWVRMCLFNSALLPNIV
jgi:hypothetical protein